MLIDLSRSKSQLVAENALLRQQLIILRRQVKRPACTRTDRMLLVLLTRMVRTWKQALFIVQPETRLAVASPGLQTLLEVQVEGYYYQTKDLPGDRRLDSGDGKGQSTLGSRTDSWGTPETGHSRVQTHHLEVHESRAHHQATRTDVEDVLTHACPANLGVRRACLSRISSSARWRAFFLIELKSRKVIHVGVTRSPTDAWTAQQLREATAFGIGPKYLIRDNDSKFGVGFARVAKTSGIEILKTPYYAPRANATCERFLGSVRREYLDHLLILHEKQHEPRPQCQCGVLQPSTTASRHQAADSREIC
jgi:hypothetical protein